MYELALCASIGGLSLGLQRAGIRTACYVEYNNYRIDVLVSRMRDGWLDNAPIWDDVTTFDGRPWRGRVDIISAGFPCQPFSVAGSRRGKEDERYLWPHILRVIRQVGPQYILLENVPGLLVGKPREQQPSPISDVLGDLATCGYDAEWQSIPAAAFGAPHVRDRVFIVAYPRQGRWQEQLHWIVPALLSHDLNKAYANPRFAEAMMGLPLGWTDLQRLEKPSFPRSESISDVA